MEIWDIYDKYRRKTGATQERGISMKTGDYVMKRIETLYPQAEIWELETILTERKNCYLYEKNGLFP